MPARLKALAIPDFGVPSARPAIPPATYAARCDETVARAACEWVVIYADREHAANIAFLTGFEPRFEEALLLLGRAGERIVVVGNESMDYTAVGKLPGLQAVLGQSMSLMGQDRSKRPALETVLRDCGIAAGQSIGLVGWKYLEPEEWDGPEPAFFVPSMVVQALARVVKDVRAIRDCTSILMNQSDGLRSVVDADEIAVLEWGAARASAAVWRILSGARVGETEFEAAQRSGYAGEPMSCHMMLTSNDSSGSIIGLSSPSARRLGVGDGVATAVGYWGGLSARAGLLSRDDADFLRVTAGYFEGLCAWYDTVDLGVAGGAIYAAVDAALEVNRLRPALNPGHLVGLDEWSNTPVRKGSTDTLRSGMPFQVDIIPTPMKRGETLNCEDAVTFADADLRADIERRHPAVHARIQARRAFMAEQIGVALKPCILPLSSTPLCLPPFWLASDKLLVRS